MDLKRLIISAAAIALAVSALAQPAMANGDGKLHVVHGIPGYSLDICIDGEEIASDLKYARKLTTILAPGEHRFKAFQTDPRTCRGAKIIDGLVFLDAGSDLTGVMTVNGTVTKLTVYLNVRTVPTLDDTVVQVRHTAVAPKLDAYIADIVTSDPPEPTIAGLKRQQQSGGVVMAGGPWAYWVTEAGHANALLGPQTRTFQGGRAYQIHLVGTGPENYRFVVVSTSAIVEP